VAASGHLSVPYDPACSAAAQQLRRARTPRGEKSFVRGHRYFTLVNDLLTGRVLYVAEDRTKASLDGFLNPCRPLLAK